MPRFWTTYKQLSAALILGVASVLAWTHLSSRLYPPPSSLNSAVLLIPDDATRQQPVTQAWLDAAHEEGMQITILTDNQFIQARANGTPISGVILPDSVHARASQILVSTLHHYVEEGGQLLISFDAGLLDAQSGAYAADTSRFSDLTGVRYGLYASLRDQTLGLGTVNANRTGAAKLAIQPGKLDFEDESEEASGELTTYGYTSLRYNYYRTRPLGRPAIWIQSETDDTLVSVNRFGRGQVLFANLPLGYLKTRTDSYLLHRIVSFFNTEMMAAPLFSSVPNGMGGMVLNLHIDSNAAEKPLAHLEDAGWFNDGPFSLHVTAGPDAFEVGDHLGLNIPQNPAMQKFLARQYAKGHEVGSHGGWNHNLFGLRVNEDNQSQFEKYLELNHQSISSVINTSVSSYSAPMGNQPRWVTAWLKAHGFKGYYSTSDSGLGPTRSYIQGHSESNSPLWTFPISNFGRIATLDELEGHGFKEAEIHGFITQLLQYVSDQHVARLFYFHPASSNDYATTLTTLKSVAADLKRQRKFQWYTMAQLSDFLNARDTVQWSIQNDRTTDRHSLDAHSAKSLNTMTWIFQKKRVHDLRVTHGQARIQLQDDRWLVTAQDCDTLQLQWRTL
jgi:hypothetical protein